MEKFSERRGEYAKLSYTYFSLYVYISISFICVACLFSHLSKSGELFQYICHCMNLMEYMGKSTQLVKGKFQESRESGKQIQ